MIKVPNVVRRIRTRTSKEFEAHADFATRCVMGIESYNLGDEWMLEPNHGVALLNILQSETTNINRYSVKLIVTG